jgi:hypothetical protein
MEPVKHITPQEFLKIKASQDAIIEAAQKVIDDAEELASKCPVPTNIRPATKRDIVEGQIIWYPSWSPEQAWNVVENVLRPDDDWKAYEFNGCRHGLFKAFVEVG